VWGEGGCGLAGQEKGQVEGCRQLCRRQGVDVMDMRGGLRLAV
jgi:hypothetical protein